MLAVLGNSRLGSSGSGSSSFRGSLHIWVRQWGIEVGKGSRLGVAVVVAFQLSILVRPYLLYTMKGGGGYKDSSKGSWLQCIRSERRREMAAALPCP